MFRIVSGLYDVPLDGPKPWFDQRRRLKKLPRLEKPFFSIRFVRFTPPVKRAVGCAQSMAEAFELPRRALPRPWMCACALPRATMRSAAACSTSSLALNTTTESQLSLQLEQHADGHVSQTHSGGRASRTAGPSSRSSLSQYQGDLIAHAPSGSNRTCLT